MKRKVLAIAIGAALGAGPLTATAQAASDIKVSWFAFSQIMVYAGELQDGNPNDGLRFGADRIRLGYKAKVGSAFGMLQVDFMRTDASSPIDVPEIIKDAVVGYKFSDAFKVKAGVFKTPVGMDFNTSGKKLDITKRGMEKPLVLERAAGLMVSGRKIAGGFGYDLGVFNPTTRSTVVFAGTRGDDQAWAGRIMYDLGKMLHLEASYGESERAGSFPAPPFPSGAPVEDYRVWNVAARYRSGPFTVKFEYIDGENLGGVRGLDQSVWYLHGGWRLNKMHELVVRHYRGEREGIPTAGSSYGQFTQSNASSADLSNTYIGWNIFLGPKDHNARIQLNYVLVSGDEVDWYDSWAPGTSGGGGSARGFTADGFLAQFQISF